MGVCRVSCARWRSWEKKRRVREGGMVRKGGLEPPRPFDHKLLRLARLPVPPLSQRGDSRERAAAMSMSHPGAEGILQREVLTRLDAAGKGGMEEGELHGTVDGTPGEIAEALARLERDGRAVEMEGRWYAPGQTGWATGTVELLDEGDALIRPGPRRDPSFYIRRRNLKRAVEGDTVVVRRLGKDRPWDDRPPEGIVVKVLRRRFDTLVGWLETDERGLRWLNPFDPKLSIELPVEGAEGIADGAYVVVAVDRIGRAYQGRVVEVLGDVETPGVDVL